MQWGGGGGKIHLFYFLKKNSQKKISPFFETKV